MHNEGIDASKYKPSFSSLAPQHLSDGEFATYTDEFIFVYRDPSIRNIAISGPYGAGKSSVIETLKESKIEGLCGHEYRFVSLANFNGATNEDGGEQTDTGAPYAHRVEEKILLQLVHQLGSEQTPKSRFARTVDGGISHDLLLAVAASAFVALSVALFRWYGKGTITAQLLPRVLVCATAWVVLLCGFLYQSIRHGSLAGLLRKLKIGSFEVDLGEGTTAAPLDRYMDDLVYLINASGSDVIVFEDLDRFGSVALFEKLREINSLANSTKKDAETKPIRFFYLIKDSLFLEARDRTKFFDFIIPVVPYVDPSNAESILLQRLGSIGVDIDQTFLYQLGVFIDDPRILDDIVNEFTHYAYAVLPIDREIEGDEFGRLLAIIAYKSLFPRDFELLQVGRGCLAALLAKRNSLAEQLNDGALDRIMGIDDELEGLAGFVELSRDELTLLYGVEEFRRRSNNYLWSSVFQHSSTKEIIDAIRSNESTCREFDQIAEALGSNTEYQARFQDALDLKDRRSAMLLREKDDLERQIAIRKRLSLHDLLAMGDSNLVDSFFELSADDFERREDFDDLGIQAMMLSPDYPLVRFLLLSGMIDDSYRRYTSYLHPGGIDPEDADFVVSVLQGKATDEARPLHNPDAVIIRLDDRELMRKGARSWPLFTRLIQRDDEKAVALLRGVEADGDYRFIAGYICSDQYDSRVFDVIEKRIGISVADLAENETLAVSARRDICHRFISDESLLGSVDESSLQRVGAWASSDPSFLATRVVKPEELAKGLARIGYKPTAIDILASDGRLLREVVDQGLFRPYCTLVDELVIWDGSPASPMSEGRLATAVNERCESPFYEAVDAELALFVSTMLEGYRDKTLSDAAEAIAWILGSDSISDELAETFASRECGDRLTDINHLGNVARKGFALEYDLVTCSANNILHYVSEIGGADSRVIGFLTRNGLPEDLSPETCEVILGSRNALVDYLATTEAEVPVSLLSSVASACEAKYEAFDFKNVPDDRLSALIGLGCIEMNGDTLSSMRSSYQGHVREFAVNEFDDYVRTVTGDNARQFRKDEAMPLLEERGLSVEGQLALLGEITSTVHVSTKYRDDVNAAIIDDHFDASDLGAIAHMHVTAGHILQESIEARIAGRVTRYNVREQPFGTHLLAGVLEKMTDKPLARSLMAAQLELSDDHKSSRSEVRRCLIACGRPEIAEAIEGSRRKLSAAEADEAIIRALISSGMLSPKSKRESDGGWIVHKLGTGQLK